MQIHLSNPRGFCAGVDRAIDIVNRALDIFGPPIYVRHEVVHNQFVVDKLKKRGAIFVDELKDIPDDNTVIFSAHGVSKQVSNEAVARKLKVFDATCPLVTKVHLEVSKFSTQGMETILIGHKGHPEVEGTMGQYDDSHGGKIYLVETTSDVKNLKPINPNKLSFVTQTTLSVDDCSEIIDYLRSKFPNIVGPRKDDICYATQNRQDAVKQLSMECDLVLVVGSPNSSNSNRLKELAQRCGARAYLIDNAHEIEPHWLKAVDHVGVTAGASAPESLVQGVVKKLQSLGGTDPTECKGKEENISFNMPKELK